MSAHNSTYINPLTDFGFKYIFGREEHKEFLLSFLNAAIPEDGEIIDVQYVHKEQVGEHKNDRALIYDLHCTTSTGKKLIVEMQNRYQSNFKDRALYYLASDFAKQGRRGEDWNYELTPVYGLFMMNFAWKDNETQHVVEEVCLINKTTSQIFTGKLRMLFFKIPLLDKSAEDCTDTLEQWLYLLKNMEKMDKIPTSFGDNSVFKTLDKVAKVAVLTPEQRNAYDHSLKSYRDTYAIMQTERAEGRAEGRLEGIIEMAKNLLRAGVAPATVVASTGCSKDELRSMGLPL